MKNIIAFALAFAALHTEGREFNHRFERSEVTWT